jgi:alpha-tubulin suppressor-like RCC1 family protein
MLEPERFIKKTSCGQHFIAVLTSANEVWIAQKMTKVFVDAVFDNIHEIYEQDLWKRVRFPKDLNVVDIGCGIGHCAVLTDTGEVFSWGRNRYGCLGQKNQAVDTHCLPAVVTVPTNNNIKWKKIYVKTYHMFLQTTKGHIYAVGYQKGGRLGQSFGTMEFISEPMLVEFHSKIQRPIVDVYGAVPGLIVRVFLFVDTIDY